MLSTEPIKTVGLIGAGTMSTDIAAIFVARGIDVHVVSRPGKNLDSVRERIGRSCDQIAGRKGPRGAIHIAANLESLPCRTSALSSNRSTKTWRSSKASLQTWRSMRPQARRSPATPRVFRSAASAKVSVRRSACSGCISSCRRTSCRWSRWSARSRTDPALAQRVGWFMESLDCMTVMVKRDIPGFLANRLQHALMREAWSLIDRGIASPEDVDKAVRFGFGMRYLAAGPVLQKEHSGLDVNFAASSAVYPDLCNDDRPPPVLGGQGEAQRTRHENGTRLLAVAGAAHRGREGSLRAPARAGAGGAQGGFIRKWLIGSCSCTGFG